MPKPMDMFDEDAQVDTPDNDVAGVVYTVEELQVLVGGFTTRFWELYCRIPTQMQVDDVEDSIGTSAGTDSETIYRAKGSYLALKQLKDVPAIAAQVLEDLTSNKDELN